MNKKTPLIFLITSLLYVSCEKDEAGSIPNPMYAELKINGEVFNYYENENNYESRVYYSAGEGNITYGGGLSSNDVVLSNSYSTPLNNFLINFHNIEFDEMVPGDYPYYKSYKFQENDIGVEISWMSEEKWSMLIDNYRRSSDYQSCSIEYGSYNCEVSMRNNSDLFSSRHILQEDAEFRIDSTYLELHEKLCNDESNEDKVYDLIIEGSFSCSLVSELDTNMLQEASGSFRMHMPSSLKFECNN